MIKIDTAPVWYFSYLDEKSFYEWANQIPCITSVKGGFFHVKSKRLSKSDLFDLIAIMHRYRMPMKQLQQFCNSTNERWFQEKEAYWYKEVFGDA